MTRGADSLAWATACPLATVTVANCHIRQVMAQTGTRATTHRASESQEGRGAPAQDWSQNCLMRQRSLSVNCLRWQLPEAPGSSPSVSGSVPPTCRSLGASHAGRRLEGSELRRHSAAGKHPLAAALPAPPAGVEPATLRLGSVCSIQLSYGGFERPHSGPRRRIGQVGVTRPLPRSMQRVGQGSGRTPETECWGVGCVTNLANLELLAWGRTLLLCRVAILTAMVSCLNDPGLGLDLRLGTSFRGAVLA